MVHPLDLRHIDEKELFIAWDDGHRSLYAYDDLRLHCPCAGCIDETSGRRRIAPDKVPKDIRLLKTEPVGRYALRFLWSDNHQTGIYSFEYLRRICNCPACGRGLWKGTVLKGTGLQDCYHPTCPLQNRPRLRFLCHA